MATDTDAPSTGRIDCLFLQQRPGAFHVSVHVTSHPLWGGA